MIKFTVTPESKTMIAKLVLTGESFQRNADRALKTIAEQCAKDVVTVIQAQEFPNAFITPGWVARKRQRGLDARVLIATQNYMKSIKARKVGTGIWGVVADLQLKRWLEEGTQRMPRRPHWQPVLDRYEKNFAAMFADEVMKSLFGAFAA